MRQQAGEDEGLDCRTLIAAPVAETAPQQTPPPPPHPSLLTTPVLFDASGRPCRGVSMDKGFSGLQVKGGSGRSLLQIHNQAFQARRRRPVSYQALQKRRMRCTCP